MSATPGPDAGAGASRSSGVLFGVIVGLLALVALVAILSGGGDEPAPRARERSVDAEERAIERGSWGGGTGAVASSPPREIRDAGVRGGPEGGVLVAEPPIDLGPRRIAPVEAAEAEEGAVRERPPVTVLSLDVDYERTSTFVDFLVARREQVVAELAEARRIHDGRMIRRLEPDEDELNASIERFTARRDELWSRMVARDAEANAAEGAETEAGEP